MAVPDSLTLWREFVDRQPVEPRRMTMKQTSGLSPDEKAAYDQVLDDTSVEARWGLIRHFR
jgi:hypothetical protein